MSHGKSRSNLNADGFVNPADFGWIGVHFFRRGLGELAAADLNRDGWLDGSDLSISVRASEHAQ